MISKELLSEVLQQNVTSVYEQKGQYRYTTTSTNGPWTSGSDVPLPNIYELAHKCKEYARSYDYYIESVVFEYGSRAFVYRKYVEYPLQILVDKNEPAVIFKAAEYIMQDLK